MTGGQSGGVTGFFFFKSDFVAAAIQTPGTKQATLTQPLMAGMSVTKHVSRDEQLRPTLPSKAAWTKELTASANQNPKTNGGDPLFWEPGQSIVWLSHWPRGWPALTCDSNAGVNGGIPAGTDDDHIVGLGEFPLDEQPEHLGEALGQGVSALDDMHTVVAGAGGQTRQPGQLCRSHGCCCAGGWREGLWGRLLVLPYLGQV